MPQSTKSPWIWSVVLAFACGCSNKDGVDPNDTELGPLYAMMVQVYSPTDRTVYVSLSNTLDITSTSLETSQEFPGVANFAEVGGRLLISSGAEPKITEYEITGDQRWVVGRSVSFASYPLSDNANFYYQFLVDEEHALLPYEGTKRILWNPKEMEIERSLDDTTLTAAEPNMILEAGGNRNSVHYDASVMQAFFYHDENWFSYGGRSHIVVYDPATFSETKVLDIACPGLTLATRDEQGNTYFSNWDTSTQSITGAAPPTCIAKIGPNQEVLETIDTREWTGGRIINNFRYIGNGKAVGNVLHHEELGVSSPADLSSEVLENLWMTGPQWKLWLFDVAAHSGAPVQGIDVAIGSGSQFAVLDGRTFVFLPYDDWGRTKGYELSSDGTATARFDTLGDVFKWVRIR